MPPSTASWRHSSACSPSPSKPAGSRRVRISRCSKSTTRRQGFVDHAAFLALRAALPGHLQDPVTFLYFSGWRVSEMRGLEWCDVDLPGRVVRLRPELSKNKDGRVLSLSGELLAVMDRAADRRRLLST